MRRAQPGGDHHGGAVQRGVSHSGVILTDGTVVLKGAVDAIVAALDQEAPPELKTLADEISSLGATPLAIRRDGRPLGVIELKEPSSRA